MGGRERYNSSELKFWNGIPPEWMEYFLLDLALFHMCYVIIDKFPHFFLSLSLSINKECVLFHQTRE